MLRVSYRKKPDPNLVQTICQLAKARNEAELVKLIVPVPEDAYVFIREEHLAAVLLAKEKDINAALFLVDKCQVSKWLLMFGLGEGGHVLDALHLMDEAKEASKRDFHKALVWGLGYGGHASKAKTHILEADNRDFLYNLMNGFGQGGHVQEAIELINVLESEMIIEKAWFCELRRALVWGLGYGGHIREAEAQIRAVSEDKRPALRNEFVWGYSFGGYFPDTKEKILRLMRSISDADLSEKIAYHARALNQFLDPAESLIKQAATENFEQTSPDRFFYKTAKKNLKELKATSISVEEYLERQREAEARYERRKH